jgi:membrane fusion protein (multidrug efflux system)
VADPVKIPPQYEEEEDVKGPAKEPVRVDERRSGEHSGFAQRRLGFFRTHPRAKWIVALVALALVAAGIFVWHHYAGRESTDDAQIDGHINPISPRVTGTVLRVLHDDNELVEAGTLLVELDPRDYEIAMDRARADLANAQANATAANVGVPLTQTTSSSQLVAADAAVKASQREIESAQARLNETQANYTRVSTDLKRMEQLIAKDEVSRQQYDAAVAANSSARATVDAAAAAVAAAESRSAQAQAQAGAARTVPEQLKVTRARGSGQR